jgi:hypothetical protein
MRVDLGPANHHAALCISRLRWLSVDMKDLLRKEGLWEDLIQELYAAALFAWKQGMDEAETRRYAHRRIYAFLKAYGFRLYCRGYVRPEMPLFGVFADVFNRGIAPRDAPAMPFISGNDNHLDEKILDFLRKHPEGLTRAKVAMNFQISVLEADLHLAPMIEQGKVAQMKRENTRGRPPTPLLVALEPGQVLPEPKMVKAEQMERIRQAYFAEGKSIKQIAREFHHCRRTVRKAIRQAE